MFSLVVSRRGEKKALSGFVLYLNLCSVDGVLKFSNNRQGLGYIYGFVSAYAIIYET